VARLRKFLMFITGVQAHRALMRATLCRELVVREGASYNPARPWGRYLSASEAIVQKWGTPWMRRRVFGREQGVWIMAMVLALMTGGCGVLLYGCLVSGLGGIFDDTPASVSTSAAGQR
jgi:hypothetical protein